MWVVRFMLTLAALYAVIIAGMYFAQNRLLFPTMFVGAARAQPPASTRRLEVRTPDGGRLAGVQIPSQRATADGAPTLLGFGGNAWNAEATALSLHALFPHRNVVVFHYRGYAPSSGRPSAQALFSDSLIIFDHLNPGRRAHRSGRLQHRRCGRRISWPVSPCCGTDPSHAIRLARGGGP
jgi:hypothetical protein